MNRRRLLTSKTAAMGACLALAAIPALARADRPADPGSKGRDNAAARHQEHAGGTQGSQGTEGVHGKGHSQRCRKPVVQKAWVVSGAYGPSATFTATKNPDGTYSGTIDFTVTHTNHHAKGATGPFAFSNAKVTFDSATATAPAAGDDVRLIGKVGVARKRCTSTDAGKVTIRRIAFSASEPKGAAG